MKPPHYYPILKGRMGEFQALRSMAADVRDNYTPVIEVAPTGNETLGIEPFIDLAELSRTVAEFNKRLRNAMTPDTATRIAVDAGLLPDPGSYSAIKAVLDYHQQHGAVEIIPVVRPSDREAELVGLRNSLDRYSNVIIRLAGDDLDDVERPLADSVSNLIDLLRVDASGVTVLVDMAAVSSDEDESFKARFARLVVGEVSATFKGQIAVGAGGFPPDLNDVRPESSKLIPRRDARLWNRVLERVNADRPIGFSDYAIANPAFGTGAGFAPAPQIRYTVEQDWLIAKGRKNDRRGNKQFLDICGQISALPDFDAGLSWADSRIAENARFAYIEDVPDSVQTGNAMTWRALGTNHHMSLVIKRLSTLGAP